MGFRTNCTYVAVAATASADIPDYLTTNQCHLKIRFLIFFLTYHLGSWLTDQYISYALVLNIEAKNENKV